MRKYILESIPVDDYSLNTVAEKVISGKSNFQIFLNVHKIVMMKQNPKLFNSINEKDCIYSIDGMWVKWLAKNKTFLPKQRFGGLDVIEKFCQLSEKNNLKIYLLGSKPEVMNIVRNKLKEEYPKINLCGYNHGYFKDEDQMINKIISLNPDILFLALPSPRKELLGYKIYKRSNSIKYAAGVGGAFDIIAGLSPRAPIFIQNIGLEWLYRVLISPNKLFIRYLRDGISFLKILSIDFLKK